MWDRWVEIEPGDIAYFPEGLEHATRNPRDNDRDFVLVNSISPPQFDLYEPFGYYDKEQGVMRFEAIEEAKKAARVGNLSPENDLCLNDSHPQLDPYMETEYYRDGKVARPAFSELG